MPRLTEAGFGSSRIFLVTFVLTIFIVAYVELRVNTGAPVAVQPSSPQQSALVPSSTISSTILSTNNEPSSLAVPGSDVHLDHLRQESGPLSGREWESYEAYTANQKRKLDKSMLVKDGAGIKAVDTKVEQMYIKLFKNDPKYNFEKKTVLCLAARLGGEVRSFTRLGALAVGVDLNPGKDNPWVVQGDFHKLQFASGVFDYVFTNAMDHAFNVNAVTKNVCRVLKPDGEYILDIGDIDPNYGTGKVPTRTAESTINNHESLYAAAKPELLVEKFKEGGMEVLEQSLVKHELWTSLITHFRCVR